MTVRNWHPCQRLQLSALGVFKLALPIGNGEGGRGIHFFNALISCVTSWRKYPANNGMFFLPLRFIMSRKIGCGLQFLSVHGYRFSPLPRQPPQVVKPRFPQYRQPNCSSSIILKLLFYPVQGSVGWAYILQGHAAMIPFPHQVPCLFFLSQI